MDGVISENGPSHQTHHLSPRSADTDGYLASHSSDVEKARMDSGVEVTLQQQVEVDEDEGTGTDSHTINTDDPFPIDPHLPVEERQFTFRAVLVGCTLGAIISASNIYLGLKSGLFFGASLFGAIFGFAILKPLSTAVPSYLGGGYFGPKENNVVESAATAAGSLALVFTTGFPATYQLGLLSTPSQDIGRLFTFTICCAFFGLAFSIPLRKFYILRLRAVFPSAVATAYTIRSMHVGKNATRDAKRKIIALALSFCFAITLRVVSEYAPGILWDWHLFYMFNRIGWTSAIGAESWGWILEWTPAFVGMGMITGINVSYSFLGGTLLAWAIIGPAIVSSGKAFGIPVDESIPGYMSYNSMLLTDPIHHPSPRYWLLWPGTMMLLCASFAEVACNWKSIYAAIQTMVLTITERFRGQPIDGDKQTEETDFDPVPADERVPVWMWGSVLVLGIAVSCVVMNVQFGQNVGVTLLAIIIAILFSLVACECSSRTSINPAGAVGIASQLIFGGLGKGQHYSIEKVELLNSLSGMLAMGAADQAADMIADLKTAHLLRSSPKAVFGGQLCGAIVSIFMAAGVYVAFSTAYPCINDLSYETCSFLAPGVQSWRAVATAVSSPELPIPPSSGYTAIGLGILAVLSVVARYAVVPRKYHVFIPNFSAMGIGFILSGSMYSFAMFLGSTVAFVWQHKFLVHYQMYCFAVAAGFIAGEGLGGVVNALLTIVGIGGAVYGTSVGCPGGVYCG